MFVLHGTSLEREREVPGQLSPQGLRAGPDGTKNDVDNEIEQDRVRNRLRTGELAVAAVANCNFTRSWQFCHERNSAASQGFH